MESHRSAVLLQLLLYTVALDIIPYRPSEFGLNFLPKVSLREDPSIDQHRRIMVNTDLMSSFSATDAFVAAEHS